MEINEPDLNPVKQCCLCRIIYLNLEDVILGSGKSGNCYALKHTLINKS